MKLWKKSTTSLHPVIEAYTVGEDYILDQALFPFDIHASKVHAEGLARIDVLTEEEKNKLCDALDILETQWRDGKVEIRISDEDCHTVIEQYLVIQLGDIGKKIHTGRSRNDQVLVAMRLYIRDQLDSLIKQTYELTELFLTWAKTYQNIPLPGYTHTQQAMLSSVGHYASAFVESLLDDIDLLYAIRKQMNKNPLGSAAGFGVSFPLDRAYTTEALAFDQLQMNSLYCQNSKGKYESLYLHGLSQIMLTLGTFANDMLLFTSREYDFFAIEDNLVTGSSIMPQKRNVDAMEILRANVAVVLSAEAMIKQMRKHLISGYNRDLQLIKKPLMQASQVLTDSVKMMKVFLQGITPNEEAITLKLSKDIWMADFANELVQTKGMAFRDAYREAYEHMDDYVIDIDANIKSKISPGAPGNLCLEVYEKRLKKMKERLDSYH